MIWQMETPREVALRKYFMAEPEKPPKSKATLLLGSGLVLLSIGILAIFTGDSVGLALVILGLLLLGTGSVWLVMMNSSYKAKVAAGKPKPSDKQVEQWRNEGLTRVTEHSRFKLNLDDQESSLSDPLVITAPILWETTGMEIDDLTWKIGNDGVARFGVYRVTVIRITERHLASYACDYNFISDQPLNECTDEIHYRDVVSVSTREKDMPRTSLRGKKFTKVKTFSLFAAGGESINVTIGASGLRQIVAADKIPDDGADKAVAAIRALLRDKKD